MTISSGPGEEGQAGDAGRSTRSAAARIRRTWAASRAFPLAVAAVMTMPPAVVPGVTASLGIVPGMGMTFANEAGPRRNAAAPPSPAAAGSWSRSAPAARMPRTVR